MSRQMRNGKVIGGTSNNASAILYQPAESGRSETNVKAELDRINTDLSDIMNFMDSSTETEIHNSPNLSQALNYTATKDGYVALLSNSTTIHVITVSINNYPVGWVANSLIIPVKAGDVVTTSNAIRLALFIEMA